MQTSMKRRGPAAPQVCGPSKPDRLALRLPSTARTSCWSLRRWHRLALLHLPCPSRPCHYHRRCAAAGTGYTSFPLEEPFSHNRQDESPDRASPSTAAADGRTLSSIPKTIGGERDHKETSCHFYKQ